jgi:hypothetical protein
VTPWFRRRPLHEQLALDPRFYAEAEAEHDPDPRPLWGEVGVHGIARARRWDVTVTLDAPELAGDRHAFAALPDGTLVTEEDTPDGALTPLADAVEDAVSPPYRAEAVRQTESTWAVAARRIEVVRLPVGDGNSIDLTVHEDGERTLDVDGMRAFGGVLELERLAGQRYSAYSVHAERLDGELWDVRISPL